jgi:hypothetical protein
MAGAISVQEAVRLAREALGDVPVTLLAGWIGTNLGLTVKPVIVTVILGSFQEKEHLERTRQQALELAENASKDEPAEKPRARKGGQGQSRADTSQAPREAGRSSWRGCPECGSGDYGFRGRKHIKPDPAKGTEAAVETKYSCKGCGHTWKVRVAGARTAQPD